jgi:acetolactate synthase I/II/III large subunit
VGPGRHPSGAIGGGLCYALAAKKAKPSATVFALMGDGTVGFHLAEFETAARANTPFIAVIGNDECWNAEHQIQLREYGEDRLIGCQLSGARYDEAVRALGGHGEYVTELSQLEPALERAIRSGKVACINVAIEGLPAPSGAGH